MGTQYQGVNDSMLRSLRGLTVSRDMDAGMDRPGRLRLEKQEGMDS